MDYVNEYLGKASRPVAPLMRCADGTTLSVQASASHYCTPKSNTGPYSSVEVWQITGPTGKTISLPTWGDGDKDNPYGWVPVGKVNAFIARHGGLA